MPQAHKTSFLITLSLLFLLPIFFIPGGALTLENAKAALFSFGILATLLVFVWESWREGSLTWPKSLFLTTTAILPLIYLLSAFLSTPTMLALFGYNLEVGTFGYILFGSLLLTLAAVIFSDSSRALQSLVVLFASLSLVTLFAAVKVFFNGNHLVWGNFFRNTDTPIGSWTDLGVSLGLLAIFSAFAIGMIPMKRVAKVFLCVIFALSTILLMIVNFSGAFALTLGASILLCLYFAKVEKHFLYSSRGNGDRVFEPMILPIVLGVISLLFIINPNISATRGTLGDAVASAFKIDNSNVRPSLSATLNISKAVLSEVALLGSGPNTFGNDWLIHKPLDINATPFWAVAFPFGIGFIPTQIATTGILGTALWLLFFVFFIGLGIKVLGHIPESRAERFTLISTFLIALFLWTASFFYVPSATVLLLAFLFSGIFVAMNRKIGTIPTKKILLGESSQISLASVLVLIFITIGAFYLGWVGVERTISALHWKKAIDLSNTEGVSLSSIEDELLKALEFSPEDRHYIALSRLNFTKAQTIASAASVSEENQALFQESLAKSIQAARSAVTINPASYQNWVSLGMIYSALVPEPLKVEGAYEHARFAYNEAMKKNPTNPELLLLLAQLELNNGSVEEARSLIRNSVALKEDYANAYLMLASLEVREGNTSQAIVSTERLALLLPNNPGIFFELGFLKYSNNDYQGAIEALSHVLSLSPDYANAKYYLSLSLIEVGRLSEARTYLEDLSITNPDSLEIKALLESL